MPNSLVLPIQLTAVGDCTSTEKKVNIWQKAFETLHWNEFFDLRFSKYFAFINGPIWSSTVAIIFSVLWRVKTQRLGSIMTISKMKS